MPRIARVLIAVALASMVSAAAALEPPTAPILRLETGMHTAVVNRLSVDAAGTLLATASDDKTVRLWRLPGGEPLGVLRPPIGPGDEGALYAVALSPDGRRLLAGGHTGASWDKAVSLYVFDVVAQRLIGRLPGLPEAVYHLAYSPDGKRIAAAFGGRAGLRVWDAADGRLLGEDRAYGDRATWVAFDAAGRIATASFDGEIRLYDAEVKLVRRAKAPGGRPFSVAFSPDGDMLAVGYADRARVDLLSAQDLGHRSSPDTGGLTRGALNAVAWDASGGGVHLLAAGTARDAADRVVVRRWRDHGRGAFVDSAVARNSIGQIEVVRDHGALFASAEPSWGLLDRAGRLVTVRRGDIADFRNVAERRLAISGDGSIVEVATGPGAAARLRFDLRQRLLAAVALPDPALGRTPTAKLPPPADWRNQATPRIAGRPIRLELDEIARSLAATPDGKRFLLGTDYGLRLLEASGIEVGQVAVPAAAWGVVVAGNGETAVALLGDGTIRWYSLRAGEELTERLAMFPHADGRRWVAWTPEGFFDHADQGGKELVGYQLNRGKAQAPDWIGLAQIYRLLYSQELVAASFGSGGAAAIRARLAELGDLRDRLQGLALPAIEIVAWCPGEADRDCKPVVRGGDMAATPASDSTLPSGVEKVRVQFRVVDRGSGLGRLDVYQNGRNVGHLDDARHLRPSGERGSAEGLALVGEREIALEPGPNRIEVRAYDGRNEAYALSRPLALATAPPVEPDQPVGDGKDRLFVLAVGIDRYPRPLVSLDLARADATTFVATLRRQGAGLFREIKAYELYDEAASSTAVDTALRDIAAAAEVADTVLIYLAGHGQMIDHEYYFVTGDIDMANVRALADLEPRVRERSLSGQALVARLGDIRARNGFVFLDTCHSGALRLDSAASRINDESGRYVLAAAASVEAALDSYDGKNGLFAYAVTEALNGKARRGGEAEVNNLDLGIYVVQRVGQLAQEKRHQQSARFKIATQEARLFPVTRPR